MKKYLYIPLSIITVLLSQAQAFATHIFGGELLYTHSSGNTYTLTLTLYGDCGAPASTFNSLYTAQPRIGIYRSSTFVDTLRMLPENNTGIEVSPVCPSQLGNTECSGGTLPGVRKFVYTADVTISIADPNWRFIFDGNLLGTSAGRSSNITNISAPSANNLVTLEARLNNTGGDNSSPQYNTIPTPYYAVNLSQEYNQGAVDPDGDSLSFSLIPAVDINGNPVTYIAPATPTAPVSTAAGQFSFNLYSGQMSFLPDAVQDALIVNEVTEYKNGIMVGSSMREMTFIVLDNLGSFNNIQNTKPINISGGALSGNNIISTCQADLGFDIYPGDTAHNNISVTYTSLPSGANIAISNNGTATPRLHFSWNTASYPIGTYIFYVIYQNNACPISTSQTIAYTINITAPYKLISVTQQGSGCNDAIPVEIIFTGKTPANLLITQQTDTIWKLICPTDTVSVMLPVGDLTGTFVSADNSCITPFNFTVSDPDALPCCHFSYPSAFSPNNDGRNDRFRVITSSQPLSFDMSVYDRWGNRVYKSSDPTKGWDGTYKGRPCNADVYFYLVYTKCLGKSEKKKGNVTLVW